MNSTEPTTPRPLNVWIRAATMATGATILAYATSLAVGGPLIPTILFVFVMVPAFALGCLLPYAMPIRRRLEARQLARANVDAQLVRQVFAQLPASRAHENRS
jgi:hypothetical protein